MWSSSVVLTYVGLLKTEAPTGFESTSDRIFIVLALLALALMIVFLLRPTAPGRPTFRVVHLTTVHQALDDRIFLKQCRSLARAGYDVTLVATHGRDEVIDGVHIRALARPRGRMSRILFMPWRAYREALRFDADLYHFHDPELIAVALLLVARGKKVVYDMHEFLPATVLHKYYLPRPMRRPVSWACGAVERFAAGRFAAVVTAHLALAETFTGINPNVVPVRNFPLTGELVAATPRPWNERSFAVAYVGGITAVRGVRECTRAMTLLPFEATLDIAGPYSPSEFRDELVREHGWRLVREHGVLSRDGVADLLAHVRGGLCILHAVPNHVRTEPIKLFEYMSAGVPVIASNFPLWCRIIEGAGCGLVVDPTDPHAIARAIEYVLTHPAEAEAMGRCGLQAVRAEYNWDREEAKLLELYGKLVGAPAPKAQVST